MPRRYISDIHRMDEPIQLDMKKEPKENMKLVLSEITSRNLMSASKKMGYVNNFTKLIQAVSTNSNFGFSLEEIILCLRIAVCSKFKEVRAAAVRAFRYLFTDEESFAKMMKLRVDIFIVRCLDKLQVFEVERVQALRFVRKVVAVCPHLFPMSFAHSLVAIAGDKAQEKDRLGRACIATMCELAVANVQVASYCGGVNTIISCVLDSKAQRMNECLVLTLLYLINNPMTRSYVRSDVGLEGILAPFTDLHYNHSIEIPDSQLRDDRETRLQTSKMAIATVFKTWAGLISLCKPDGTGLESLLQIFCLPDPVIKKHIMDILIDVFRIPVPEWTDDFVVALKSIDPRQMQDSWKLSEGFVAEEAQSSLPQRANVRVDLLRNYTALVLTAFMNAGLFESLVQVITTSEDFVSVRATIVLGELLHMANTLLPPECSSHTHCLPTLMNIATSFQVTRQERGRASSAVNCLDRLHQLKKRALGPYSLFLEFLTLQSKSNGSKNKQKKREREKESMLRSSFKDVDYEMIRDIHANFAHYNPLQWDIIADILETPAITLRKLEENGCSGFVQNLLQFYKPSSQQFCAVELKNPISKKLSDIGLLLIEFLLANYQENQRMLEEFVEEFSECLGQTYTDVTKGVFSDDNLVRTTSRNYFVFFGKLSFSSDGHKLLGTTGVYQHYLDLASIKSRDNLLKLILASLDYSRADISRIILAKILTSATLSIRLYATKFLRTLLRAKVAFFNNWGIEMLVTQLYDPDRRVVMEAADVLEEACEDEANLQYLVQLRPALLHLGEKGCRLLTRFLSVDKGFTYLSDLRYLDALLDQWCNKYCEEYVKWIEESLAEALTTYQKPSDEDGGYVRQSSIKVVKRNVYVPTHFFGEIVKLKSGYEHLKQTGYASKFARVVRLFDSTNEKEIHDTKTALWALGHIGTSSWGLSILEEEEIIPDIVDMATRCNVLTIRGTCFYVLGLIATTRQGADILKNLNWVSVRHRAEVSWPVVEVKEEALPCSKLFVSSLAAATDYYRQSVDESVKQRFESEVEEVVNKKSVYDDDSGVYLGTENRRSNVYDKSSGVYLGEEAPQVPRHDEGTGSGILLRLLEEKQQEMMEDQQETSSSDERSRTTSDEAEDKSDSLSLLDRIKKASIPAHLMPPPNEPVSMPSREPRRTVKGDASPRRDGSPRPRKDSRARSASVLSNSGGTTKQPENENTAQPKIINLNSFESTMGDDSLISRILKTDCVVEIKDKDSKETEDSSVSPQSSSTPRAAVPAETDDVHHVRSSSGVSDSSFRSMSSSVDTSQSLDSYKSQTSLNNSVDLHLDLERKGEKVFRGRLVDLNRTRSSSLNEKGSSADPRLIVKYDTRSASFSGTADDMERPVRAHRQTFRSEYSVNSPCSGGERSRLSESNTEVMLLDNKTLVLKNLKPDDGFDNSYLDQMSVSDGLTMSSVVSRNDVGRDIAASCMEGDNGKRFPKKGYSRSMSSSSSSYTPRPRRMKKSVTSSSIWSLLSVPLSPTSPCDLENFESTQVFPSFRDAHGYSALSNLRKHRSFNRDIESRIGGFNQSFTIVGPPIPESRPLSLDLPDTPSYSGSMVLPSPSPLEHTYSRKLKTSTRGNEFLGLTLPNNLSDFFMVEECEFKGSWADNFSGVSTSVVATSDGVFSQESKVASHDENQCLSCMDVSGIVHVTRKSSSAQEPGAEDNVGKKTDSTSGNMLEKIMKGKRGDVISTQEIALVKKEILRLVVNLSSAVTSKSHQQSLRGWKENLPQLFEDLCLYSQVVEQMSLYKYKLSMRRYIQGFFENVKFTQLIDQAEAVAKKNI